MVPQPDDDMASVVAAIVKYGMAGVAGYLLWIVTNGILVDVHQANVDIRQNNLLLQQHMESSVRMERQQLVLIDIQRQQCVNGARSYIERQSCFVAGAAR